LNTQYILIQKAKEVGNFGEGNMNMWYKAGVTHGASISLFVLDAEAEQNSDASKILPWAIGGGVLAALAIGFGVKRFCTKTRVASAAREDDMQEGLTN
jgi:hypothetical protein